MKEPVKCAWASADQNPDAIWIATQSGYRGSAYDPRGKETTLGVDADDESLGGAVQEALEHSRFLPVDEVREFMDFRRVQERYDDWTKSKMQKHRYRNKAALFGRMKHCGIEQSNGVIRIFPSIHDTLEGWLTCEKSKYVIVPADSSASEIGAALRLAFSRCVA